jgi:hypothetical protein
MYTYIRTQIRTLTKSQHVHLQVCIAYIHRVCTVYIHVLARDAEYPAKITDESNDECVHVYIQRLMVPNE